MIIGKGTDILPVLSEYNHLWYTQTMPYDLLVTGFRTPNAKTIVAHQLAHDPSISLQRALSMVENPPVVLFRNLTKDELRNHLDRFTKVGVQLKVAVTDEQPPAKSGKESQQTAPVFHSQQQSPIIAPEHKLSAHNQQYHAVRKPEAPLFAAIPEPPARKRTIPAGIIVVIILIGLVGLLSILSDRENRFKVRKSGPILAKINTKPPQSTSKKTRNVRKKKSKHVRKRVSPEQIRTANLYLDSARAQADDLSRIIKFYKIALSFNPYNLGAWHGLIDAYRDAGMTSEMNQAEREMKEIFGEEIFSIAQTVEPFGEIIDSWLTDDGTFRVEYRTRSLDRQELVREALMLSRALRSVCNCSAISLFAVTGPGKGLIAHSTGETPLHSLSEFESAARIVYLD